jgi:ACS family sodium-dependent inorganic phosphate cotransporter-like MFS transporter 5
MILTLSKNLIFKLKILGSFGIVWFCLWILIASNKPSTNRFISKKEQEYIEQETNETMSLNRNEMKTPWLQIMKSIPALTIFFGHLTSNWATYLFTTSMPTYIKEILKFDIQSV